jgi:hypothetical protein
VDQRRELQFGDSEPAEDHERQGRCSERARPDPRLARPYFASSRGPAPPGPSLGGLSRGRKRRPTIFFYLPVPLAAGGRAEFFSFDGRVDPQAIAARALDETGADGIGHVFTDEHESRRSMVPGLKTYRRGVVRPKRRFADPAVVSVPSLHGERVGFRNSVALRIGRFCRPIVSSVSRAEIELVAAHTGLATG